MFILFYLYKCGDFRENNPSFVYIHSPIPWSEGGYLRSAGDPYRHFRSFTKMDAPNTPFVVYTCIKYSN